MIKAILLTILGLLLIGCTKQTILIPETKVVKIPESLLYLPKLQKPQVDNERDIINAYIDLFQNYCLCKKKIEKIKEINQDLLRN